jgi:hypothetical protein
MRDRHALKLGVARKTRRSAGPTARAALRNIGKTVAAEARHRCRQGESKRMIDVLKLIWPAARSDAVDNAVDHHANAEKADNNARKSLDKP